MTREDELKSDAQYATCISHGQSVVCRVLRLIVGAQVHLSETQIHFKDIINSDNIQWEDKENGA